MANIFGNHALNGGKGDYRLSGGTGNDHLNGDAGRGRSMLHRFVRKLGRGPMKLEDLDDRMLLDIGLTRHDLEFIRKKKW